MIQPPRAVAGNARSFPRTTSIGVVGLGLMFFATGFPAEASPRTRMEGLTNRDARVQSTLDAGDLHTCVVRHDGTVRCWGRGGNGRLGNDSTADADAPVDVRTITTAVGVSGGELHTCALLVGGTVQCWGGNDSGQLGDNSGNDRDTPATVSGLSDAVAISAGGRHTCALIADGTVRCWGLNSSGQLGDNSLTNRPTPVAVSGLSNVAALAAGTTHTCALVANGTVRCWGSNFDGRLGDGTTTTRRTPVAVRNLDRAVAISASSHTCAVRADGTVRCWGSNSNGQLGDGTTTRRLTPVAVAGLTGVATVAAGATHTCVVRTSGSPRCWGRNFFGQLGDATFTDRFTPVGGPVIALIDVIGVTVGLAHSCALRGNGTLRCWGHNVFGELGNGTTSDGSANPLAVVGGGGGTSGRDVAAGAFGHTCAVRGGGGAACWGLNEDGQVGDDTTTDRLSPVGVDGLATQITAGGSFSCDLRADGGTVRCWGRNTIGQLGDGTSNERHFPGAVAGLAGVMGVSAGTEHACVVLGDGSARCWGFNFSGQVGDGNAGDFFVRRTPVAVSGLANAVAIAAGNFNDGHTCALVADGTARCWGANGSGQLGDGTTTRRPTPVTVTGLSNAVAIAGGGFHTCALSADGTVRCWGRNEFGQLGDGTTTTRLTPVAVAGLTGVVAVAGGGEHNCALRADGGVRCWGKNEFGQLGDNSTTDRVTPVAVAGLTNAVAVSAGARHTCAVRVDGAIFCWGDNETGQLGDGTTTDRLSPVEVPSFRLNIEPVAELIDDGRTAIVTAVATCPEGQEVQIRLELTQDGVVGHGLVIEACTGGLAPYRVPVTADGATRFQLGPAQAEADAIIRDGRTIVDVQEWSRAVTLQTVMPGTVTHFSGSAQGIGLAEGQSGVRIVGRFTADPGASVDCTAPATLLEVLSDVTTGTDIAPLPHQLDVTGKSATTCVFENVPTGPNPSPPFVRLLIDKAAPGVFNFRLELSQATRVAIDRCPIPLRMGFDLPGVAGPISVIHTREWRCVGSGNRYLRAP